jgi:hypothetical protein
MSWWERLRRSRSGQRNERVWQVRLAIPGWHYEGMRGDMRGWRDDQGDMITLVITSLDHGLPELSDELALQYFARSLAESRGGGLIEVRMSTGPLGPTVAVIYKRLELPRLGRHLG